MSFKIYEGDCREIMDQWKPNIIDAVVTDPPYGLEFMGKDWDKGVPGVGFWEPLLRIMKPGAHALVFGGTRTHHRLMCALEDAGFEIRDCLMWVYGSGFPKGLDIGKAIDKAAGAKREVIGTSSNYSPGRKGGLGANFMDDNWQPPEKNSEGIITTPATDVAKQWEGWGTALKPAWEPIILCRKPLSEKSVAANVLRWGTGGLNIDGCRIGTDIITTHSRGQSEASPKRPGETTVAESGRTVSQGNVDPNPHQGRFPANLIHDGSEEVVGLFPQQKSPASYTRSVPYGYGDGVRYGLGGLRDEVIAYGDSGPAARFFYCAKASKKERDAGLDGQKNDHPTVKPLALLEYLVKLITPPDSILLDPFCGSGSTLVAAQGLSQHQAGIELQPEYCEIARIRIAAARNVPA